jgi:hypothetical protein
LSRERGYVGGGGRTKNTHEKKKKKERRRRMRGKMGCGEKDQDTLCVFSI